MRVGVSLDFSGFTGMKRGELKERYVRPMFEEMGSFWFTRFLPRHFEPEAMERYQYTPRKASYNKRKARERRHMKPLVWSGELRRETLGSYRIKHAGYSAKVILRGARKANYRHPSSQVRMAQELVMVTGAEARKLLEIGQDFLDAAIDGNNDRHHERVA